jgi:hypothetical protein
VVSRDRAYNRRHPPRLLLLPRHSSTWNLTLNLH